MQWCSTKLNHVISRGTHPEERFMRVFAPSQFRRHRTRVVVAESQCIQAYIAPYGSTGGTLVARKCCSTNCKSTAICRRIGLGKLSVVS